MKKIFIFLFLWLFWGFFLGTLFLLGPVRWTVDQARINSWSNISENSIVYVYMGILVIITFLIALYSVKFLARINSSKMLQTFLIVIPVIGSILSLYAFLHPDIINADSTANKTLSAQFAIGPYPELPKMYELKNEGYTAIISLLHPAVIPFEPTLIEKERANALEAGLQFINIPFLPWISDNEKSIDSLRRLVRTSKEKYYIHCYLGRDRTSAATRIVEQENQTMVDLGLKKKENLIFKKLERGDVIELQKDVFLAPEPTKEEYFDVVDDFEQVVFLSDLKVANNKKQLEAERAWLKPYKIPITPISISKNTTKEQISVISQTVKSMPKPVFIHGYAISKEELSRFRLLYQQVMQ